MSARRNRDLLWCLSLKIHIEWPGEQRIQSFAQVQLGKCHSLTPLLAQVINARGNDVGVIKVRAKARR